MKNKFSYIKDYFKKTPLKLQLFIFLFIFLIYLSFSNNNWNMFYKGLVSILSCVVIDSFIYFIKNKSFKLLHGSMVSGAIIGFVLSSDMAWWIFSLAGLFAILSKHIIKYRGKHIFNSAAFGTFIVVILFDSFTMWNGAYSWFIIIPAGLYFTYRVRKLFLVGAYSATFLLFEGVLSFLSKTSFLDSVLYANYFFILIMMIDPGTAPNKKNEKIYFGVLVYVISFIMYKISIPFDAVLPALLLANLGFKFITIFKGRRKNEK